MAMIQAMESDGVLVIIFVTSAILDESAVHQVGVELDQLIDATLHKKVVLDLGRIGMMTSSMIGRLVAFKRRCDDDKIKLQLCNLSKDISELFKMTRLERVFDIKATREKAIKSA